VVNVPAGYGYVVDATGGGSPLAVFMTAGNFLGGNGPLEVTGGSGSVATGNGADVFNMSGTYSVAAGSGNDQYNLAGTGQVSLGGGLSLINIVSGADTIFAGASPGVTGLVGHSGSVFFYAGAASTNTANFITGGSGGDTIVGAADNTILYASPSTGGASAPGALLVAGAGSETIYGAPSSTNDLIYGSYSGSASDLLWAGSGNDALVAGSGNQSLVGGAGTDTFYIANPSLLSTIAGTTITPGKDTIFLTHSGDNLALIGYDTLYGGAPGSNTAATAVKSTLASSSGAVTLKDGTTITFVGSTSGLNIISS
jgi:Ca2+-binding RTX toxin-like protein